MILCSVLLISGCNSDNITGGAVTNTNQNTQVDNSIPEIQMQQDSCAGVTCSDNQKCVDGNCVSIVIECDSSNPCPSEKQACHKGECVVRCWDLGSEHD